MDNVHKELCCIAGLNGHVVVHGSHPHRSCGTPSISYADCTRSHSGLSAPPFLSGCSLQVEHRVGS